MKSLKIAKYQFMESMTAIGIFYSVLLILTIFGMVITLSLRVDSSVTGLEYAPIIFLFVTGITSFKNTFKFSQANNVSRRTFFKGMLMGLWPIALLMSIFGVIFNRIFNIFQSSPTTFDLIYLTNIFTGPSYDNNWVQNNHISTLLATVMFQFALYIMVLSFGILISLIYYRCNKLLRIVVSFIPFTLLVFSYNIYKLFPITFWQGLGKFLLNAFGLETKNSYMAVLSLTVLGLVFASIAYLLNRKAIVKE